MSDHHFEIVLEDPWTDGVAEGRKLGSVRLKKELDSHLRTPFLANTLGAMSRRMVERLALDRLETQPDFKRFPELQDLYPERVDRLRGVAHGAGVSLAMAAAWDYTAFRVEIGRWYASLHDWSATSQSPPRSGHCSGVLMVGPDGVLGAHSMESLPLEPRPRGYRWRDPGPYGFWKVMPARPPTSWIVRKPRTGYMIWGVTNEKGLACCCGTSGSVWMDESIEDTWPLQQVPLLRFAGNVEQLVALYRRYTLHNWGRGSQIWADIGGNGVVIEKSFRRIGVRELGREKVLWCTEGHFESDEMSAYMRRKRLEYIEKAGKHLGAGDMQYATDCAVRFTRLGELCHEPLGWGLRHMNRVLTDHATFPRAVCRHGGPDTAPYDRTVTQACALTDLTHNRAYFRKWVPWRKFPCQVPWTVTQYPPIPG